MAHRRRVPLNLLPPRAARIASPGAPRRGLWSLAALIVCAALMVAACGPEGPVEAGGDDADPVAMLTILPSPGQLRGEPATAADEAQLQVAMTGAPDDDLTEKLKTRGLRTAAVRTWTGPDGEELVAVVAVWQSHLLATGIGAQAAEMLLTTKGAKAWTPPDLGGSRGARVATDEAEEQRLSFAVGPNNIYVRATGNVDDDVVETAARQLITYAEARYGR